MKRLKLGPVVCRGHPFQHQLYDLEWTDDGRERFSLIVPDPAIWFVHQFSKDPQELRKWIVGCLAGREFDLDRCSGLSIRITEDNKVEVRLEFLQAWYLDGSPDGEGQAAVPNEARPGPDPQVQGNPA